MITAKGASPAPTLIRAFRPLQDAFGPPAGARRYMTSKRLIWLILWRMITGKSQGRIDDSPCYPAFTGVEARYCRSKFRSSRTTRSMSSRICGCTTGWA